MSYPWGPQMDTPNPQLRWTSRKTVGLIVVVLGIVIAPIALVMVLTVLRDLSLPSPITPDRSAIIGTWTNPDGATLTFDADGTVTASGIPELEYLPKNGTGTWNIEPWDANADGGGGVGVRIGTAGSELTTTGDPAHPTMFAVIGDLDDGDYFPFTHANS